jgi:hypothetical protein
MVECSVRVPDTDSAVPVLRCVTSPTTSFDDITIRPAVLTFESTATGIASVSSGLMADQISEDLAPLYDWIRTAYPTESGQLLSDVRRDDAGPLRCRGRSPHRARRRVPGSGRRLAVSMS